MSTALILAAALIVDAIVSDPKWLYSRVPHPVVLMSKFLMTCEQRLNKKTWSRNSRRLAGAIVMLAAILLMFCTGFGVEHLLPENIWGNIAIILIASTLLAGRGLFDHVRDVGLALNKANGLEPARQSIGHIIGRNTDELDEPAIARAALESLSENFSDGVVAPALWFLIGGLPGMLVYKMINTADSMIGYRNERFLDFGWAAARIDDVANLIPARLTAILFSMASLIRGRAIKVLQVSWRDAGRHASPNAGWPEAAFAGALDVKLGGPRQYPGNVIVDGVWLGDGGDASATHITQGLKLAAISWGIFLIAIVVWGIK